MRIIADDDNYQISSIIQGEAIISEIIEVLKKYKLEDIVNKLI